MSNVTCVIGGGGFIGRPLVDLLIASNRKVVVIDRGDAAPEWGDRVVYHQGDYADREFLSEALKGVDEVVHLAYASVPKTSFEDPFADLLHNVPPALTLFEVVVKLGIKRLVFASSGGTVYGEAHELPITEKHATNPISPYGITKLAIEKYAGMFHVSQGLPVIIVRPANAYGEEQRAFTGQGFIATAIASILQNKEITIFGESGTVRDYIHVNDIVAGIVAALDSGQVGECYNLGTGVGSSNKEIIDRLTEFAEQAGRNVRVTHLPARTFDVVSNILDTGKITQATGWQAKVALEEGLKKTWDYWVANHG